MDPLENPLKVGNLVWRGWGYWFDTVRDMGDPQPVDDHLIVPVRYKSGQYGIIRAGERLKPNGISVYYWQELRGGGAYDTVRYSTAMPSLISSSSKEYRFRVAEGEHELDVRVLREDCGLGRCGTALVV